ncbi:MAG: hypothetical protein AAF862_14415 [Pseudomonadota bacterium]
MSLIVLMSAFWTVSPVQAHAQSSVDAGLDLSPGPSIRTPVSPKRTVIVPKADARRPAGAVWAKSAQQVPDNSSANGGYPFYTMPGVYAAICNAPYDQAQRDCTNMSSVQALGALQMMMYYGNLIGKDSVLVVLPKSKLGALAGTNGDAKLNQMTRNFRAKNARSSAAAKTGE